MGKITKFNNRLGLAITRGVGTMWCAYAFAAITLTSLPQNLDTLAHFVLWLSSTFFQLVLLSILMVGQEQLGAKTDEAVMNIQTTVSSLVQPVVDSNAAIHQMVGDLHDLHIGTRDSLAEGEPPK